MLLILQTTSQSQHLRWRLFHLSPLVTPVKADGNDGNDGNVADSSDEANDVTFELAPAAA
jgi:hypothetical protein